MTDRQLLQQALDAMERYQVKRQDFDTFADEIAALNERLAHCDRCGKKLGGEGDIHTCTPPAATGLSKLEQLLAFCDFESKHRTPPKGKKHIALWAYEEIEHWQDRALKAEAKLAQPKQEPVYHLRQYGDVTKEQFERYAQTGSITPPAAQRTWVGLTDDEISHMWRNLPPASHDFARAIEKRLKEKNNG